MEREPKPHQVTIANTGAVIACAPDQTILRAALAAGIDYPYACASGNCGQCIGHLDSGTVDMLPRSDASLSPEQFKAGRVLGCRARPHGDVTITWLGRGRK